MVFCLFVCFFGGWGCLGSSEVFFLYCLVFFGLFFVVEGLGSGEVARRDHLTRPKPLLVSLVFFFSFVSFVSLVFSSYGLDCV